MDGHQEGVFARSSLAAQQGELVDRLMAKIADLEAKLYKQELQLDDLIPAGRGDEAAGEALEAPQQHQPAGRTEWLVSVARSWGAWGASSGAQEPEEYPRYVMHDPQDVQAELEVSQQVRRAAHEALSEANERAARAEQRLQETEAVAAALQQQLDALSEISKEAESLKSENLEAWHTKVALEAELAGLKGQVDGMSRQGDSLQQELSHLRAQAGLWQQQSTDTSEIDLLRREAELLRSQLADRGAEAAQLHMRLAEDQAAHEALKHELASMAAAHDRVVEQAQGLEGLHGQLAAAQQQLESSQREAAEAQQNFMTERAVRRRLHEQLQVLRGNIRVICRVRPPPAAGRGILSSPLEGVMALADPTSGRAREYEFDAVFTPPASQEVVFEEAAPLVRSCADGYNVCIFAYGQTGSGKTFTMQGPAEQPGINTRALLELFRITASEPDKGWSLRVGMMEIYNDAVYDLLAEARDVGRRPLDVNALAAGELPANMDRVQGLNWQPVASSDEVQALLEKGARTRATAATALNAASSRSHAVVSVKVMQRPAGGEGRPTISHLHLVDLGGSERVDRSEVTGQQLKEAAAINKSLSALGDVVSALQKRSAHVPFRNSTLTQVLQDSLCGSSKVLLVCQLSPEAASCSETLSSLNFASRAAQVELGAARRTTSERPGSPSQGASGGEAGTQRSGGAGTAERGAAGGGSEGAGRPLMRPASRLNTRAAGSAGSGTSSPRSPIVICKPATH